MFICYECDETFEDPETVQEPRGQYGDATVIQALSVSPCCESDYGEAEQCKKCDTWLHTEDLHDGTCEECLDAEVEE